MPLTLLSTGEKAKISKLTGNPNLKQRLIELGFSINKHIEIIGKTFGNNLLVKLENTRIALDKKMAHHIHIHLVEEKAYVK